MLRFVFFVVVFMGVFSGCEKQATRNGEFFVENTCSFAIEVYATKIVIYKGDPHSENFYAQVQPGEVISLSKNELKDDFEIKNHFSKINFYKGELNSSIDAMSKANWKEKVLSEEEVQYTMTVRDSDF